MRHMHSGSILFSLVNRFLPHIPRTSFACISLQCNFMCNCKLAASEDSPKNHSYDVMYLVSMGHQGISGESLLIIKSSFFAQYVQNVHLLKCTVTVQNAQ
jgi:hypothetical protein